MKSINSRQPFKDYKTVSLKKQFDRFLNRLYNDKKIESIFRPHDFRHYSACSHYKRTLDIFATMNFLNHKNVTTTQIYLKGLGAIDDQL